MSVYPSSEHQKLHIEPSLSSIFKQGSSSDKESEPWQEQPCNHQTWNSKQSTWEINCWTIDSLNSADAFRIKTFVHMETGMLQEYEAWQHLLFSADSKLLKDVYCNSYTRNYQNENYTSKYFCPVTLLVSDIIYTQEYKLVHPPSDVPGKVQQYASVSHN